MGEKKIEKLPKFLTMEQLREHVVPWSSETVRRRIKSAHFPAIQDESGIYLFPYDQVMEWFKRRQVSR